MIKKEYIKPIVAFHHGSIGAFPLLAVAATAVGSAVASVASTAAVTAAASAAAAGASMAIASKAMGPRIEKAEISNVRIAGILI